MLKFTHVFIYPSTHSKVCVKHRQYAGAVMEKQWQTEKCLCSHGVNIVVVNGRISTLKWITNYIINVGWRQVLWRIICCLCEGESEEGGVLGRVVPEGLSVESVQTTPWRERTSWEAHSLQTPWQVQRSWGGKELGMTEKCEEIIVAGEKKGWEGRVVDYKTKERVRSQSIKVFGFHRWSQCIGVNLDHLEWEVNALS